MFHSLIIGYGRAGQYLHLPCLRKAQSLTMNEHLFSEIIGIVDPNIDLDPASLDHSVRFFRNLENVQGFSPSNTVVHICTSPGDHISVLRQVAELGYSKVIIEKPLALSTGGVDEIRRFKIKWQLDLLVVAVWISSKLTEHIMEFLTDNRFGPLCRFTFESHKNRLFRTLEDKGHATAFEVELPHQVALALYLAGEKVQVVDSTCSHMQAEKTVIPHMGGAQIILQHDTGIQSLLISDLHAPTRKRHVKLAFKKHIVEGCFPISGDVNYSDLTIFDSNKHIVESRRIEDDPLTTCFVNYYRYFAAKQPKPVSDIFFNTSIVSVITQAKLQSGVGINEGY